MSMATTKLPDNPTKGEIVTDLGKDNAPESGKCTDADRVSESPRSISRGGAEYVDINPDPVQTSTGQFNYDKNTLPAGVER
jgi:hypothetical protein